MKINKKSILLISAIVSIIITTLVINNLKIHSTQIPAQIAKKSINLTGAIEFPGLYVITKDENLKNLLFRAKVLHIADFKKIDYKTEIFKLSSLYIPFDLTKKIHYSYIKSTDFFIQIKIRKKQAELLFNYFKDNKTPKWSDIENIYGIGKVALKTLQDHILI
ncbi:MAG0490 family ComEA-like DNA-binding protein [Mycoplasma miroungirhinis]|uniref:Uncharacterized protein n=1 Tax=Mycoplasma miroungirhinis TaxID=754516 RepID=A0A6M4JI17_9MOLU|nr:hypothetical protein [Mycoplasma miroungirhinis]QJR44091.1 hypothetical protein HLA92_01415 [Mycoplasma miroungirhinis]